VCRLLSVSAHSAAVGPCSPRPAHFQVFPIFSEMDTREFRRPCAAPGESPKLERKKSVTIPHFPLEDSFQKVS
jgi:hypothetical protein